MSRFAQRKHGLQTGCLPKVTQLAGAEIHTQLCLTSDSIFLAVMLYCFGSSSCWEIFRHLWKQFCGNPETVMVICFPFKTHNSMMYPGKAAAFARLQDSVSVFLSLYLQPICSLAWPQFWVSTAFCALEEKGVGSLLTLGFPRLPPFGSLESLLFSCCQCILGLNNLECGHTHQIPLKF